MGKHKKHDYQVKNNNDEFCELVDVESIDQPEDDSTPIIGVVTDCLKLNIRKAPNVEAGVLCEAQALSKLMVDPNKSTDEWLCVCTEAGFEGFCMKKYVTIEQ